MSEQNKAAVRDCYEHASQGDFGALPALLTPDYVLHPDDVRGVQGLTEMVEEYRSAIGGLTVTIDHQFAEGDWVATRFTVRGTHDGDLMGAPPTGRPLEFSGLAISRCQDGKIAEEWELVDTTGVLRQIGALPEMAPS